MLKGGRLQARIGTQLGGKGLRNIVLTLALPHTQHAVHTEPERLVPQRRGSQQSGRRGQGDVGPESPAEVYPQQDEKVPKQRAVRLPALRLRGIVGGKGDEELAAGIHRFVTQRRVAVQ